MAKDGSHTFISIIDFHKFSLTNSPSIQIVKELFSMLNLHYPLRIDKIIIVNASTTFNIIWNMIKPILPNKAISKIIVLNNLKLSNNINILNNLIGLENIEKSYGGFLEDTDLNNNIKLQEYIQDGYWNDQ